MTEQEKSQKVQCCCPGHPSRRGFATEAKGRQIQGKLASELKLIGGGAKSSQPRGRSRCAEGGFLFNLIAIICRATALLE